MHPGEIDRTGICGYVLVAPWREHPLLPLLPLNGLHLHHDRRLLLDEGQFRRLPVFPCPHLFFVL
jgi:hypothetical protein